MRQNPLDFILWKDKMYGTSNGLGVGTTGKTFRLVPKHLQYTGNQQIHRRINDLSQPQSQSKSQSQSQSQPQPQSQPEPQSEPQPQSHSDQEVTTATDPSVESNPSEQESIDVVAPVSNVQLESLPKQSWPQVFQQVCTKQLFECFRQLKQLIMPHPAFHDTILAYIDFQHMRILIEDAKESYSKDGVMSLKVTFTNNPYSLPRETIENGHYLVSILELLGPQNHVIIALNSNQLKFLQGLSSTSNSRLYWPNGNEGISWFTNFS